MGPFARQNKSPTRLNTFDEDWFLRLSAVGVDMATLASTGAIVALAGSDRATRCFAGLQDGLQERRSSCP
ncbi:hypothetical protein A1351_15360 [Methylosinus sp. R-45379]|nr:hypothetical protein A1351_15360 [Methylosinus sp. R-45379]